MASPPDVAISFRKAREIGMRIPFALFESATRIFDNEGQQVRPEIVRGVDAVVQRMSIDSGEPTRPQ